MQVTSQVTPGVWDSNQYWLKAKSYIVKAQENSTDNPDYALWYAFALEHLARAVLCNFHPALNADPNHPQSLYYGVGIVRTERPKSLPIHSVYTRLRHLLEEKFTKNQESFCSEMADRRNAELHSAGLPFSNLETTSWLTHYYEVADVFCTALGYGLEDLFGKPEGRAAAKLIAAAKSDGLKDVQKRLATHRAQFNQMPQRRRTTLQAAAMVAKRMPREAVATCPSCNSEGRLEGTWIREGKPNYNGAEIVIDTTYLSNTFYCLVS